MLLKLDELEDPSEEQKERTELLTALVEQYEAEHHSLPGGPRRTARRRITDWYSAAPRSVLAMRRRSTVFLERRRR
jgi:hypothetical protein